MNLTEKYQELIVILTEFLRGAKSADVLQTFAWEMINYFSTTRKDDLPQEEKFEKVFWYVIWEVQHLVTDDHLTDGRVRQELEDALVFLKGEQSLPDDYIGRRP